MLWKKSVPVYLKLMVKTLRKKHYIIPVFVPDLGCPHQCVFCNQKKITGQEEVPSQDEVRLKITQYLQTIPKAPDITIEVAFYGGSFTAVDLDVQKDLLKAAYEFLCRGEIGSIRISTRPDAISEPIMAMLSSYGVETIELGVQSMKDDVLFHAGRGHTSRDVLRAAAMIKSWGMKLGFQLILGLPGDSAAGAHETTLELIALKPDLIRIYPCLVLKDTPLKKLYETGQYTPISLEEAVSVSADLLLLFEKEGIQVIRIGLQPSEQISEQGDIIAGPFHPAFRELVESQLALRLLEYMLKHILKIQSAQSLTVAVGDQDISVVRGNKGMNGFALKKFFGIEAFKTLSDSSVKRGAIRIMDIDGQPFHLEMHRTELPVNHQVQ